MGDLKHELAWSSSRGSAWEDCKRKIYNAYYLAWRGWESLAVPERKQAYALKKMTGFPALVGTVVHEVIANCFERRRRGEVGPMVTLDEHQAGAEDAIEAFVSAMREYWTQSSKGIGRKNPGKAVYLAEHHYGDDRIGDKAWCGQYIERGRKALRYFFSMDPVVRRVRDAEPSSWLGVESMGGFYMDGVKVYAAPDFATKEADGRVVLADWKTGKEKQADRDQVALYACYAMERGWVNSPDQITALLFYLPEGACRVVDVDQGTLDRSRREAGVSIAEMRRVHFDADVGVGDPGMFPMTENRRRCAYCEYRELCKR